MSQDKNVNYSLKKEVSFFFYLTLYIHNLVSLDIWQKKFTSFSECFDFLKLLDVLSHYLYLVRYQSHCFGHYFSRMKQCFRQIVFTSQSHFSHSSSYCYYHQQCLKGTKREKAHFLCTLIDLKRCTSRDPINVVNSCITTKYLLFSRACLYRCTRAFQGLSFNSFALSFLSRRSFVSFSSPRLTVLTGPKTFVHK